MIGIDEVGRGSWAGPLLVVAARQTKGLPNGLRDSKKITKKHRENLLVDIKNTCELGEGWVEPTEIDTLGLTDAMKLAVSRALAAIDAKSDEEIIMDGTINYCGGAFVNVQCIARADDIYPIVSAASIYAKVTRDIHMSELSKQYPDYGFEKHVGYGTKLHIDALKKLGICDLHRLSYKPIKALL